MSEDLADAAGVAVVGVDVSMARVRYAAEHGRQATYLQGSIYDLPFADGTFALVVCADLLEHLDHPDRAVKELVRVSNRNVVLSVPYCINIEQTLCPHCLGEYYLYGHQHSFGKEGIERMAREAGASVEKFDHLVPMFECRRYRWFPPLRWLLWDHFKNSGTLGARLRKN